MKIPRFLLPTISLIVAAWPSISSGQEREVTCDTCHSAAAQHVAGSVHKSLQCQECHGGQPRYEVSADRVAQLSAEHTEGVKFDHGATFRGVLDRLAIPNMCGVCHADVERMNPYGLRTDILARYKTSHHGQAVLEHKDARAAVCTDCHGPAHAVVSVDNPASPAFTLNVPNTCGHCHADAKLMANYGIPVEVVAEYKQSIHGQQVLEHGDLGSPTCATCHGNHAAMPPGFGSVGAVCGQCHTVAADNFAKTFHAGLMGFEGCVQCHGGGEGRHLHLIQRITEPPKVMVQRYAQLLESNRHPSPEEVRQAIHPEPEHIFARALPTCLNCHDAVSKDENLAGFFGMLDEIAGAERSYVQTAHRLDVMSRGVLLVEHQRFKFQDAKTRLLELAPLQHTLNKSSVTEKIGQLNAVRDEVNDELDRLQAGLSWRWRSLIVIWIFAVCLAALLYVKFRRLKRVHVRSADKGETPPPPAGGLPRRSFLDWLVGFGTAIAAIALAVPALAYLWPAARGTGTARVEVKDAAAMKRGDSKMIQLNGKPIIVVRESSGLRAFSAICTHLGCLVKWHAKDMEFKCPCHAGVFDKDGKVVSGPPPAPLPEYKVSEVGGKVYVTA